MENKKQLSDSVNTTVVDIQSNHPITSSQVWLEVKDVMSKDVITIGPEETVVSAAKTMSENNVSCILVVDNGSLTGILTEKDLLAMIAGNDKNFVKIKVSQTMSCPVHQATANLIWESPGRNCNTNRPDSSPYILLYMERCCRNNE